MRAVERVQIPCSACGSPVTKRVTEVARNKSGRFFCSDVCLHKVGAKPRKGTTRPCERCKADMYVPPNSPDKRFCSNDCKNAWQRRNQQTSTCAVCGKTYDLSPSQKFYRAEYCSRPCQARARTKRPLDREHNGRPVFLDQNGYVLIYEPDHPRANKAGRIFEHRHMVEQALGRYLERDEHVHHLNHVRSDNRPENLQLLSHSEHALITGRENGEALKAAIEARQRIAELEKQIAELTGRPLE